MKTIGGLPELTRRSLWEVTFEDESCKILIFDRRPPPGTTKKNWPILGRLRRESCKKDPKNSPFGGQPGTKSPKIAQLAVDPWTAVKKWVVSAYGSIFIDFEGLLHPVREVFSTKILYNFLYIQGGTPGCTRNGPFLAIFGVIFGPFLAVAIISVIKAQKVPF